MSTGRRWSGRVALVVAALTIVGLAASVLPSAASWRAAGTVRTAVGTQDVVDLFPSAVTAGDDFTAFLTLDGQMFAVGVGAAGQLGDGTATDSALPRQVLLPAGTTVSQFQTGINHTVLLDTTGTVWSWGGGVGTTPRAISLPTSAHAVRVEAGGYYSLAVTDDGAIYSWGNPGGGRLGRPASDCTNPCPAGRVTAVPDDFVAVGAVGGRSSGVAWSADGTVRAWGGPEWNTANGVDVVFDTSSAEAPTGFVGGALVDSELFLLDTQGRIWQAQAARGTTVTATILPATDGLSVTSMTASFAAGTLDNPLSGTGFLLITDDGGLYGLGDNDDGQLGLDPDVPYYDTPTRISIDGTPTVAAIGNRHSVIATTGSTFFAAGMNDHGQLGGGYATDEPYRSFVEINLNYWYPKEGA